MKHISAFFILLALIPNLSYAEVTILGLTPEETARYKDLRQDPKVIFNPPKDPVGAQELKTLEQKIASARAAAKPTPVAAAAPKPSSGAPKPTTATPKNVEDAMRLAQTKPSNIDFNPPKEMPFPKNTPTTPKEPLVRWRTINMPKVPESLKGTTARTLAWTLVRPAAKEIAPYAQQYAPRFMIISNPREDLDAREARLKQVNTLLRLNTTTGYYLSAQEKKNLEREKKDLERTIENSYILEWQQRTEGI